MSRAVLVLNGKESRSKALNWIAKAPTGTRLELKAPRRSSDQNALMWSLLTELSVKLPWHGLKLSPDDYKDLLTASFRREVRTVPNTEGTGFVMLGMRTSDLTRTEMSELVELIYAFAAQHGVELAAA